MLACALNENDYSNELFAYDYMGVQYFYMGDIESAKFFHAKMSHGDIEKRNAIVR